MLIQGTGLDMRALPAYINFYGIQSALSQGNPVPPDIPNSLFGTYLNVDYIYIETDKKTTKVLELPYPFLMNKDSEGWCTLNYKISSLCNNHTPTVNILKTVNKSTTSKIYDNIINIIPLN